jgi:PAS domain S-box-containing protein
MDTDAPAPTDSDVLKRLRLMESALVRAGDAILIAQVDDGSPADYKFVFVNTAFEEATGYRFEELEGKSPGILYGPATDRRERERVHQSILERRPYRGELLNYRKDGSEFWAEIFVVPLFDADGNCTHILSQRRDVTARKRLEIDLGSSNQELQRVLSSISDCVWSAEIDEHGKFSYRYCSPVIEKITGRPVEFFGPGPEAWLSTVHEEDRPRMERSMQRIVTGETALEEEEFRMIRPDGAVRHVRGSVVRSQIGRMVRLDGVVTDVTERHELEERYRMLFNQMLDGFALCEMIFDRDGKPIDFRYLAANPAFERMTGLAPEAVVGKRVFEVLPTTEQSWIDSYGQVVLTGEPRRFENFHAGLGRHFAVSVFRPARGQFACTLRDITARKKAEAELQEANREFQRVLSSISDAVWSQEVDEQGRFGNRYYSTVIEKITGRPAEFFYPGVEPWVSALHEEDRSRIERCMRRILTGETTREEEEFRMIHPDGTIRHVRGSVVRSQIGKNARVDGVLADITERKKAEEGLRQSEERFRVAAQNAGDLVYEWDVAADTIKCFGSFKERLGIDPGDLPGTIEDWVSYIHPEDRPRIMELFERQMESAATFSDEYRIVEKNGRIRNVFDRGAVLRDAGGKACKFIGVVTDITERKLAEADISLLAAIVKSSQDAIISSNLEGVIATWNQAAEELYGYSAAEALGRPIAMLMPPALRREVPATLNKIRKGKSVAHLDTMRLKKDGTPVAVSISLSPVFDANGGSIGVSGLHRDIGEQKRRETKLMDSEQRLRNLAARLEAIREEERTRIAREIHDELGQGIMAVNMEIERMLKRAGEEGEKIKPHAEAIRSLTRDIIESVHKICAELRPSVLDNLELRHAIEWQVQDFEGRTGIGCSFHAPEAVRLDAKQSTAVFRILQGLLTNVAQHSGATKVSVDLSMRTSGVVLKVADNGCGLTKAQMTDLKSLGIIGMRERAAELRGWMRFSGTPGKGTTAILYIPLKPGPLKRGRASRSSGEGER